jgi:hypothetical protein
VGVFEGGRGVVMTAVQGFMVMIVVIPTNLMLARSF